MGQTPLQTIAEAVTAGTDVDWGAAEASTDPHDREAVRQLRLVTAIGQIARSMAARWGPFELRQVIGQGTFGTVYRAWDPKVDREIALKILNESTGPLTEAGAIQEARLLATAEHPNVVAVYGADIHQGRAGIWMKFIHGKTLKEILTEQGPFGAEEAAVIGRDLCLALTAVHARGLVHRDLKAQNVMREIGGRIVLMDFGAGRQVDAAASGGDLQGTPAYLAPEVVAGGAATASSDLYSLSVLLFHLVTGEFPVTPKSWDELRAIHARDGRRRLGDVRPDLPAWFVSAVDRGLSVEPEVRPATAREMGRLLDLAPHPAVRVGPMVSALAAAVLVAAVAGAWIASRAVPTASIRASSIAILPFENATGAPSLDYLKRGLAERAASRLAALGALRAMVPAGTIRTAGVLDMGGPLGVDAILRCRMGGNTRRVRVGCDLTGGEGSSQPAHVETSEHAPEDLAALESELARRIAFTLRGPLSGRDTRQLARGGVPADALTLYLRGRHEWAFRTEDSLNRSIPLYQAAVRAAPGFALAHSGLADAYTLLGAYGFLARRQAFALAFESAHRAVQLDPTSAEAHVSLGYAQKNRYEWPEAEASFRRGLALKPDSATGHHWFSIYLLQMKRFEEAMAEEKLAMSLDPSSLVARTQFATLLVLSRRYRDGIAQWESCLALGSNQVNSFRAMSKAYLYLGDRARALEYADAALRRVTAGAADEELKADLAYVYAASGRRREAIAITNELVLRYRAAGEGIAGTIAAAYTGLGDLEEAFGWLAAAVRERDSELGYLLVDPRWDPLRSDPRFDRALADVGFPDR